MRNENGIVTFTVEEKQPEQLKPLLLPDAYRAWKAGEECLIIGAVKEQTAVGALAAALEGDTLSIRSLYVAPQFRRQGAASLMLDQLLLIAEDIAEEIEVNFNCMGEEQEALELFLSSRCFLERDRYGALYLTQLGKLTDVAALKREAGNTSQSLASLGPVEKNKAQLQLAEAGAPFGEDLFTGKNVEQEVSRIHIKEGRPDGFFVCEYREGAGLIVTGAWNGSGKPVLFLTLVQSAFQAAREKYPPETNLVVQAVNPTTEKLITELLPEVTQISRCYVRFI